MSETDPVRVYGVSYGNGNDGVSHMYPAFYVRTNDPWTLARAATLSRFHKGEGAAFALDTMFVEGEAEYTISVTILDPPSDKSDHPEVPEVYQDRDGDSVFWTFDSLDSAPCFDTEEEARDAAEESIADSDNGSWSEANGAWFICEVFPEAAEDILSSRPIYDSLEDAFGPEDLALAREK